MRWVIIIIIVVFDPTCCITFNCGPICHLLDVLEEDLKNNTIPDLVKKYREYEQVRGKKIAENIPEFDDKEDEPTEDVDDPQKKT